MIVDMTDHAFVSGLKSNFHATFDTPQGKEVLQYLEIMCCWYKSILDPASPEMTLINDGKRQVVATIKTILELGPDQIVSIAKRAEDSAV